MRYKFITIEGNIGSGKTSLAQKIAEDFNGNLILEQFADNPFLPKFYENPQKHAFPLELFFMAERYQQLRENLSEQDLFNQLTVSDYIFIKSLLFSKVNLGEDEYRLYTRLFNIINPTLPEPELLVYLHDHVAHLLKKIEKRGRSYEKNISGDYLLKIQQTYFDYFKQKQHARILVLDIANANFVADEKAYQQILDHINRAYEPGLHFITV